MALRCIAEGIAYSILFEMSETSSSVSVQSKCNFDVNRGRQGVLTQSISLRLRMPVHFQPKKSKVPEREKESLLCGEQMAEKKKEKKKSHVCF